MHFAVCTAGLVLVCATSLDYHNNVADIASDEDNDCCCYFSCNGQAVCCNGFTWRQLQPNNNGLVRVTDLFVFPSHTSNGEHWAIFESNSNNHSRGKVTALNNLKEVCAERSGIPWSICIVVYFYIASVCYFTSS